MSALLPSLQSKLVKLYCLQYELLLSQSVCYTPTPVNATPGKRLLQHAGTNAG
jgi:hypothetical protein